MKHVIIIAALITGLFTQGLAQVQREAGKGTDIELKEGMTLTYELDIRGNKSPFVVTVQSLDEDGGIKFSYKRTERASYKDPTVTIAGGAMKIATGQSNQFSGRNLSLPYRTTVWISEKVFDALTNASAAATISPDNGRPEVEIKTTSVGYDYALEGDKAQKDIAYLYAQSDDEKIKYWIHHNRNNRLILKMDLWWTIRLKSISYR